MSLSLTFSPKVATAGRSFMLLLVAWMTAIILSPAISAEGTTLTKADSPTFSPAPGSFTTQQTVTLSSTQAGVSIYYTIDGSTPSVSSTLYKSPIVVTKPTKISAIAVYPNRLSESTPAIGYYVIGSTQSVAKPTLSPTPGNYQAPVQVTISCETKNAVIRYTTDASNPISTSPIYTGPFTISKTTKVEARAFLVGSPDSDPVAGYYVISNTVIQKVATPVFSPVAGSFTSATQVSISCATKNATIRYSVDGVAPTTTSTEYTGPITISKTTKLMAQAFLDQYSPSEVATGYYTFKTIEKVATPVFTVKPGTFTTAPLVGITCATPNAVIRYTSNGTVPTATSPIYTTPANITKTTTLTVKAFKSGMTESETLTGTFVITDAVPTQGVDLMIKGDTTSKSVGEGIIDLQGSQVLSKTVAARKIASYIIVLKNTGTAMGYYNLKASGSKLGWSVSLVDTTGRNISHIATSGTGWLVTAVPAKQNVYFRLDVTPLSSIANDDSVQVVVTATSKVDETKADQVKAITTKVK